MKRFSNILAIVNTHRNEASALQRAISLAKNNQASLTVASLLEEIPGDLHMSILVIDPEEVLEIAKEEELERLKEMVASVNQEEVTIEKKD